LKVRLPEHYGGRLGAENRFLEISDWNSLSDEQLQAIAAGKNPFPLVAPSVSSMSEKERPTAPTKVRLALKAKDSKGT
jgi:hypothetical protein